MKDPLGDAIIEAAEMLREVSGSLTGPPSYRREFSIRCADMAKQLERLVAICREPTDAH